MKRERLRPEEQNVNVQEKPSMTGQRKEASRRNYCKITNQQKTGCQVTRVACHLQPLLHVHAWAREVTGTERSQCTSLVCQSLQGMKMVDSWSQQQASAGTTQQTDGQFLSIIPLDEMLY